MRRGTSLPNMRPDAALVSARPPPPPAPHHLVSPPPPASHTPSTSPPSPAPPSATASAPPALAASVSVSPVLPPPGPTQHRLQRPASSRSASTSERPPEFQCHHSDCLRRFVRKTSLTNHLKAHQNVRSRSIYRTKRARLRAAAAKQIAEGTFALENAPHAAASLPPTPLATTSAMRAAAAAVVASSAAAMAAGPSTATSTTSCAAAAAAAAVAAADVSPMQAVTHAAVNGQSAADGFPARSLGGLLGASAPANKLDDLLRMPESGLCAALEEPLSAPPPLTATISTTSPSARASYLSVSAAPSVYNLPPPQQQLHQQQLPHALGGIVGLPPPHAVPFHAPVSGVAAPPHAVPFHAPVSGAAAPPPLTSSRLSPVTADSALGVSIPLGCMPADQERTALVMLARTGAHGVDGEACNGGTGGGGGGGGSALWGCGSGSATGASAGMEAGGLPPLQLCESRDVGGVVGGMSAATAAAAAAVEHVHQLEEMDMLASTYEMLPEFRFE